MNPLEVVRLPRLMSRSQGRPELAVALIDGPVALDHPDLSQATIKEIPADVRGSCSRVESMACMHGTFVAGILAARRDSPAPAICPGCTLILRPIFAENGNGNGQMPSATPEELANAIADAIGAGASVINLSAALVQPSLRGERQLQQALDHAAQRGVLVVAAAGNQGTVGSSILTRHPWVIPVAACDLQGRPTAESNLGSSIGQWGLAARTRNAHQPGDKRQAAGIWRNQRGRAVRYRRDRVALVRVSHRQRRADQAGRDPGWQATAENHRAALVGCLGGV